MKPQIVMRDPSGLRPHPKNPRRHSEESVAHVASLIERYGWTQPILVDEDGTVLAGHKRRLAAISRGDQKVPVIVRAGLDEGEKLAYVIADNQATFSSPWDTQMLGLDLGELKTMDFDLGLIGIDGSEMRHLINLAERREAQADPDAVPEVPETPRTRPGDLWRMGRHRLLCGDAESAEDVGRLLENDRPHLMVTDAPYGVRYDPAWRDIGWTGARSTGKVANDHKADWSAAIRLFSGDVIYWWSPSGADQLMIHMNALISGGFDLRWQIIWAKQHFPIGRGNYHQQHEPCWYAVRKGKKAHWHGGRKQTTVWDIQSAGAFGGDHRADKTDHGTQKPVECMRRPIVNNSLAGDLVYDPFVGSGTTIIAAEMEARACLAMEIDPVYCDMTVDRWQRFTGETATREDGALFDEVRPQAA